MMAGPPSRWLTSVRFPSHQDQLWPGGISQVVPKDGPRCPVIVATAHGPRPTVFAGGSSNGRRGLRSDVSGHRSPLMTPAAIRSSWQWGLRSSVRRGCCLSQGSLKRSGGPRSVGTQCRGVLLGSPVASQLQPATSNRVSSAPRHGQVADELSTATTVRAYKPRPRRTRSPGVASSSSRRP